ncbi:MAG: hypothetical protein GF418_09275 [Chitinivibrionales bacterium]|nr:hypothetical protein [Chitinivibrionales bacterium]MBD3395799.1 hypothetical protein [Chitinivibrionales bacterium]
MTDQEQRRAVGARTQLISLIVSGAVLLASLAGGITMVAGVLEGFGADAFLSPLRLSTQILGQLPGFAIFIVVVSHVLILGLVVRTLAVPRLRQSSLWYAVPASIVLLAGYWFLACRGVVTVIQRLSE